MCDISSWIVIEHVPLTYEAGPKHNEVKLKGSSSLALRYHIFVPVSPFFCTCTCLPKHHEAGPNKNTNYHTTWEPTLRQKKNSKLDRRCQMFLCLFKNCQQNSQTKHFFVHVFPFFQV